MKKRESFNENICKLLTDTARNLGHVTRQNQRYLCVCGRNYGDGYVKDDLTPIQEEMLQRTFGFVLDAVGEALKRQPVPPQTHHYGLPGGMGI